MTNKQPEFYGNIDEATTGNTYYRHVLATTPTMQLVVMSLAPNEDIGMEVHPYTTQFIRIENGIGLAKVGGKNYALAKDMAIIIPPATEHNIINTSHDIPLKLYTLYAPPNHARGHIDIIKPSQD